MNYKYLSEKYGSPLYIFSLEELSARTKYIRNKIDKNVSLCYAMKANPFLVGYMGDDIERIEVCSPGEYEICKLNKIPSSKLVISGVNKDEKLIDEIISTLDDEILTIESMHQFEMIESISTSYQKCVNILIRLTSGNQFGVSEEELKSIVKKSKKNHLINVSGIEYFSGTQKHSLKKIEKEFLYLKDIIESLKIELDTKILELEYGTGFPIFYFEGDEFNEDEFLSEFNNLLSLFKETKVTLEIGRSLVASSGSYLTKVVDMKKNETGGYAIVDGGIHQLVYYGSTLAMKTPIHEVITKSCDGEYHEWTICGSLCSINDIIVKKLRIKNLQIGDLLVFKNTGAYSMTEGISLFLSRDLPKVILINNNNDIKVLRESIETYPLNTQSEEF